jgi:hypothetical protein
MPRFPKVRAKAENDRRAPLASSYELDAIKRRPARAVRNLARSVFEVSVCACALSRG